jgi:hypothetical protein
MSYVGFCACSQSIPHAEYVKIIVCQGSPCLCSSDPVWLTKTHAKGTCASYGICGHRRDGDVLNCANNTVAQPISSIMAQKLQALPFPDCLNSAARGPTMKAL